MGHSFELTMEDYTIILNALHYYKKVEKYPNFSHFDEERINKLRDKMAYQLIPSKKSKPDQIMLTIFNHVTAFWSVVVMNCIQPANWQYCYRVDEWLLPELSQGVQIYFDKKMDFLYKSERDYLDKVAN